MHDIIYLEPDEEITSVIDKLKVLNPNIKTLSLVIPKGATILQSVVNLKLLRKECEALEKDLSIVTQDRIGRNLASQAGFTVFDNVNSTHPSIEPSRPQPKTEEIIELDLTGRKENEEKAPKGIPVHRYDESQTAKSQFGIFETNTVDQAPIEDSTPPTSSYKPSFTESKESENISLPKIPISSSKFSKKKKILIAVGIVVLIILGVLTYFYYPRATITLAVKGDPFEQPVQINVDNNINKVDENSKSIPGLLVDAEQEGGKKFTATGKKEIGEKAKGTISVSNDSGTAQSVAAGTQFKSDGGLTFVATSSANVPGATATVDSGGNVIKTLGKADVTVEASDPGDQYNIAPGNFTVVGKSMLTGRSTAAMTGGLSKQLTIVSQNDLNNAKNELSGEVSKTLHDQLKQKAGNNKIIDSAIGDEVLSSSSNKNVGEEADQFEMKVKVKSSTISFLENDYRQMVVKALEGFVPQDKELVLSSGDEISTTASDVDISRGKIKLNGNVKTKLAPKIDQISLKNSLKGKSSSDAENIIKINKNVESVNISFRPSWFKKVPSFTRNISIKFEYK